MARIRCFVCARISDEAKAVAGRVIQRLASTGADVRWVKAENLHLTLKFLGDVDEDRLDHIGRSFRESLRGRVPFTVRIAGLGVFPDSRRPRVIWCGITGGQEALAGLAQRIDEAMEGMGFARERRPFSPHLTLGRSRSQAKIPELVEDMGTFGETAVGDVEIDRAFLMKSQLGPDGPRYSILLEAPFS